MMINVRTLDGFIQKTKFLSLWGTKVYIHVNKWIAGTKEIVLLNMNMKGISDQDHEHAHQVWNRITPEFQNVTLEDLWHDILLHEIYLATDVLLMSDVVESF